MTAYGLKTWQPFEYGPAERTYGRHLDQNYAIGLDVFKERGANLVEVGTNVVAEIGRIGATSEMQGIELIPLEDQAVGVKSSLAALLNAGAIGALLSILVLYAFVRNVSLTLMVALAVPVSITVALAVMYFIGVSLNILSMMGLMLAVGMLVDNAVVVAEAIFTEKEKTPEDSFGATVRGASGVSIAVIAGTLTTAMVFLPNIFGEQNQISIFLFHVAIAIVVSLMASLLISQTMIPVISARLQPPKQREGGLLLRVRDRYERFLGWSLNHRPWVIAGAIVCILSVAIPGSQLGNSDFDEGEEERLFLRYNLDAEYSLEEVKEAVDKIEDYLYTNQDKFEIENVYSYYDEQGTAQSTILLRQGEERTKRGAMIKEEIRENLPVIPFARPQFGFGNNGPGETLSVAIVGESSAVLATICSRCDAVPAFT